MDKMKILVVDDESRMRKLVSDFLTRKGYAVIEAADGVEAVDTFMENKDIALIILLQELETYIERIGKKRILDERIDFGLISPYKAQVQYLRGKIKGSSFLRPFRSLITVNTVDGFQGQERDVIFISLVRANEDGQIGFLNDLRRMNVAITRARMKLVILGDASTLAKHPFYKRLMLFIKKED